MSKFTEYLEAVSSNKLKFKMNSGNKVYNDIGRQVTGNLFIEFEPNDNTSETYYIFDEKNVTFFRIQTSCEARKNAKLAKIQEMSSIYITKHIIPVSKILATVATPIKTKKDFTDLVYKYVDSWDYEPQYSGVKEKVLLDGYLLGEDDEKLEKKISSFFGNKVPITIEYNEY